MKNKFRIFVIFLFIISASTVIYASSNYNGCTHAVYNDSSDNYHYKYCSKCGLCYSRYSHTVSRVANSRK